jgi:putative redox protein
MGVFVNGLSKEALKLLVTHESSGTTFQTAAPVDNGGDGSSFSPTDLLATALGSCAATVAELAAKREGIPLSGMRFRVEKIMHDNPRRVGVLRVHLTFLGELSEGQLETLKGAARRCPVRLSLSPDLIVEESYSNFV